MATMTQARRERFARLYEGYHRFAKAMDWATLALSIAYAAWCLARDWPHPTWWTWTVVASCPLALGLALVDYKSLIERTVRGASVRMIVGRGNRARPTRIR